MVRASAPGFGSNVYKGVATPSHLNDILAEVVSVGHGALAQMPLWDWDQSLA